MGEQASKKDTRKHLILVIGATIIATLFTLWAVNAYVFPRTFKPVHLSQKEQQVLETKLEHIGITAKPGKPLEPQRYSETGANREVTFSEREINALIANNTNLASKLAIDLDDGLISARLRLPLDPDMPFVGGKVLKASVGVELSYSNGRPSVVLIGVSLWGVPVPNAWLGNLKNIDLVREFGTDEGFWQSFAAGIENIKVENDTLSIKLKE